MKTVRIVPADYPDEVPLQEKAISWLSSKACLTAINDAVQSSQETIEALAEDRKVLPEKLNEPITF